MIDSHIITIVVSGLSGLCSVSAGFIFKWLRDDISHLRTLIEKERSEGSSRDEKLARVLGILEGKGISK